MRWGLSQEGPEPGPEEQVAGRTELSHTAVTVMGSGKLHLNTQTPSLVRLSSPVVWVGE